MVELVALVIVWTTLNVCEKMCTPDEKGHLIVWALAGILFIPLIWVALRG